MDSTGKAAIAEFIGTFALIFFGAGAIIAGGDLLSIALAHGLAIAIMVSLMAHISGGVFNPAIQIALFVTGKMPAARSLIYIGAQILGGIAAAYSLKYFTPEGYFGGGGAPAIAPGYALGKAVVAEALGTFFLVWAVFASAVDNRSKLAKLPGLWIGLTLTIVILAIGTLTGAAVNPARWLGPALAAGDMTAAWVWILGPVTGAIIAGVGYWFLYLKDGEPVTP